MASKCDPADYSTVHRWNSLLRLRFLLGSETIDIIANGTGLETDDVMRPTSVTGARFLDPV